MAAMDKKLNLKTQCLRFSFILNLPKRFIHKFSVSIFTYPLPTVADRRLNIPEVRFGDSC